MKNTQKDSSKIEQLKKIIEQNKKLEAQKELFIATLSHDLKTPLQSQISALKILLNEKIGILNEKQKEIVNMLLESSYFMREMLYSLLTVYKCDNGVVSLKKSYVNLHKLILKCISEIYYFALEKEIRIEYKNFAEDFDLYADENYIKRVISNILNNAVNYAFKGTLITIIIMQEKESIKIKIKSISSPIPEDLKEHIFDKYMAGMNQERKLGIGLGLYFCKKVVEAHNGEIYLNANNMENEFIIRMPEQNSLAPNKMLTFN